MKFHFSKAKWLQDPRFDGLAPIDIFHRSNGKNREALKEIFENHKAGLSNLHMQLRKTFVLEDEITSGLLNITADDYYKLYINGTFVGQGPANGYYFNHYYNTWDITSYLKKGENLIAVHLYYQGNISYVWNSMDHRMGMIAQAQIEMANGLMTEIVSDHTWKYKINEAITSEPGTGPGTTVTLEDFYSYYGKDGQTKGIIGSNTQFLENIDARKADAGWCDETLFDDSSWNSPSVIEVDTKDYTFVPQPTPPLEMNTVSPKHIKALGNDRYLLDFGKQIVGYFGMRIPGKEAHIVEIRHSEQLDENGYAKFIMQSNVKYQEFWTLSGQEDEVLEFYDYKGFRYVEVLHPTAPLDKHNTWATTIHYPFPVENHFFLSSNSLLNQIWEICRNGIRCCSQDQYLDCPTREKGQYVGDIYFSSLSHLYLTGDHRLVRKAIDEFALTSRFIPGLLAVAPGAKMVEIADYSLYFPMLVERDYKHNGDIGFVKKYLPVVAGVIDYFSSFENEQGILENYGNKRILIDHPKNMRNDYDMGNGCISFLNALYYGAKSCLARLKSIAGEPVNLLYEQLNQFKSVFNHSFYCPETGLYLDAVESSHHTLQANAVSLLFGLVPEERKEGLIHFFKQQRMACGAGFSYLYLSALYEGGAHEFANELILSRDTNSWYTMIQAGATSCMEAWHPDQKSNCSYNHQWTASPISMIVEHVLGIQPAEPGWEAVRFDPHIFRSVDQISLKIPTPKGPIQVSYSLDNHKVTFDLELPSDVPLIAGPTLSITEYDQKKNRYVLKQSLSSKL